MKRNSNTKKKSIHPSKKAVRKIGSFFLGTTASCAAALGGMTVYAAETNAGDGVNGTLSNLATTSENVFSTISSYTWILIAAALIICGILYVVGGEEGKQRANKWVPRILIGTVLILGAVSIAKWVATELVAF